MRARVLVVDALDVAEQDEEVGIDQVCDQGRERVVLAERAAAQFLVGDHVVLVDDRHHAVLEQTQQGVADVEVAASLGHVAARDQRLRGGQPVALEERVVALHELGLADGGQRLSRADRGSRFGHADAGAPGGDCARCDDGDLCAGRPQIGDLAHDLFEDAGVEPVAAGGEQVGAQLADDPSGLGVGHRITARHAQMGRRKRIMAI